MNHVSVAKVQNYFLYLFTFPRFSAVLRSAKTNFVLKFSSKAMAAENGLPCLLVKPLSVLVLPLVSKSVMSASSEQLSCYLLEHWHTALLVAASYYLSEELHGTLLAFRTLAAGILVAEKSVTT